MGSSSDFASSSPSSSDHSSLDGPSTSGKPQSFSPKSQSKSQNTPKSSRTPTMATVKRAAVIPNIPSNASAKGNNKKGSVQKFKRIASDDAIFKASVPTVPRSKQPKQVKEQEQERGSKGPGKRKKQQKQDKEKKTNKDLHSTKQDSEEVETPRLRPIDHHATFKSAVQAASSATPRMRSTKQQQQQPNPSTGPTTQKAKSPSAVGPSSNRAPSQHRNPHLGTNNQEDGSSSATTHKPKKKDNTDQQANDSDATVRCQAPASVLQKMKTSNTKTDNRGNFTLTAAVLQALVDSTSPAPPVLHLTSPATEDQTAEAAADSDLNQARIISRPQRQRPNRPTTYRSMHLMQNQQRRIQRRQRQKERARRRAERKEELTSEYTDCEDMAQQTNNQDINAQQSHIQSSNTQLLNTQPLSTQVSPASVASSSRNARLFRSLRRQLTLQNYHNHRKRYESYQRAHKEASEEEEEEEINSLSLSQVPEISNDWDSDTSFPYSLFFPHHEDIIHELDIQILRIAHLFDGAMPQDSWLVPYFALEYLPLIRAQLYRPHDSSIIDAIDIIYNYYHFIVHEEEEEEEGLPHFGYSPYGQLRRRIRSERLQLLMMQVFSLMDNLDSDSSNRGNRLSSVNDDIEGEGEEDAKSEELPIGHEQFAAELLSEQQEQQAMDNALNGSFGNVLVDAINGITNEFIILNNRNHCSFSVDRPEQQRKNDDNRPMDSRTAVRNDRIMPVQPSIDQLERALNVFQDFYQVIVSDRELFRREQQFLLDILSVSLREAIDEGGNEEKRRNGERKDVENHGKHEKRKDEQHYGKHGNHGGTCNGFP